VNGQPSAAVLAVPVARGSRLLACLPDEQNGTRPCMMAGISCTRLGLHRVRLHSLMSTTATLRGKPVAATQGAYGISSEAEGWQFASIIRNIHGRYDHCAAAPLAARCSSRPPSEAAWDRAGEGSLAAAGLHLLFGNMTCCWRLPQIKAKLLPQSAGLALAGTQNWSAAEVAAQRCVSAGCFCRIGAYGLGPVQQPTHQARHNWDLGDQGKNAKRGPAAPTAARLA
jgi:hypothetical protein